MKGCDEQFTFAMLIVFSKVVRDGNLKNYLIRFVKQNKSMSEF